MGVLPRCRLCSSISVAVASRGIDGVAWLLLAGREAFHAFVVRLCRLKSCTPPSSG